MFNKLQGQPDSYDKKYVLQAADGSDSSLRAS